MEDLRTEDLYAAAFDHEEASALPALLARFTGGRSASLHWGSPDGAFSSFGYSELNPEEMRLFLSEFIHIDPWLQAARRPRYQGRVVCCDDLVPPSVYERSAFYNDFVRVIGDDTFWCIGGTLVETDGGIGVVGVHRGRSAGAFSKADRDRLAGVSSHLSRVLRLKHQLSTGERQGRDRMAALSALGYAILIVRTDGRVLDLNSAAEALVRGPAAVVVKAGRLGAAGLADGKRLESAVARATARADPGASALRLADAGSSALLVEVVPLVNGAGSSCCMVLVREEAGRDATLEGRLSHAYRLTPSEASLAVALSQGCTPAEIAEARGVEISTVRTQLKSLSAKLECNRLSQAAALVAKLPMLHPASA